MLGRTQKNFLRIWLDDENNQLLKLKITEKNSENTTL